MINCCIERKKILAFPFIIKVEQQRKIIETSLPPMPFGWQIVAVSLFNHILDISKPDSKGVGNLESGFFIKQTIAH
ncbi:MAG TPA: hypothetical protein PKW49_13640 [Paludibacteraceae bacterium]|nr:hypothetical protein [Paludibacteraceae bacterium]